MSGPERLRPASAPPRLATLVSMTALSVLSLGMFLPSLPSMAETFEVPYSAINAAIAAYLFFVAGLQFVIGPLSDRYGRRPIALCGLGVFTLASVGCALSTSLETFLFFRLAQGAVAVGLAVPTTILRDLYDAREAAAKIGLVGMGMSIAPILGPTLGGVIETHLGWRANFVAYALAGGAVFTLAWLDLGETNTRRSADFGAQFRSYPALFRSRRFWAYAICSSLSVGHFYAFITGVPLVGRAEFGLSPTEIGLGLGSVTIGFALGNFLTARLGPRFEITTVMIAGRLATLFGLSAGLAAFLAGMGSPLVFFAATISIGLGNGLTLPTARSGALSVRPQLAGSAAGLEAALSVGGGAAITSIIGAIVTRETGAVGLLASMTVLATLALAAALLARAFEPPQTRV